MRRHLPVGLALLLGLVCFALRAAAHDEGEHVKDAVKIKFTECPAAVQKTLTREARGARLETVELGTVNLQVAFSAHAQIDGQTYVMQVSAAGKLVSKTLDDSDGKSESIAFAACPPAVQKTLAREADGPAPKKVNKTMEDGRTLYRVQVKIDGEKYDLSVTAEGLLLTKEQNEDAADEAG